MSNWIPEIISVKDIGNAESSFLKLKENFDNGHLLIFFNNPLTQKIKPILKLEVHDSPKRKMILTTADSGTQKFVLQDWAELYESS